MKIAVAFALCLLLFTMFVGDNGIQAVLRIQRDARALAVEISALKQENERLRISADKLRDDPHTIEVVARETLGFDFPAVLANDVGVVYARSGPIVVSYLGNAITGNYGEAEDRIGRFAQQLVEYFDK